MNIKLFSQRSVTNSLLLLISEIAFASLPNTNEVQLSDTITLSSGHNAVWSFTSIDGSDQNGMTTINYYDDFGRIEETVQAGITPSGNDMVSLNEYNAKGLLWRQWLDGKSIGSKGSFVPHQDCMSASITSNSDNEPYSVNQYETSPLNRMVYQYGPGNDWHVNEKRNESSYQLTLQGTSVYACKTFNVSISGYNMSIYCNGTMRTGALDVICSKDEDNREVLTFKDKRGWLMLTRQKISNTSYADTYYLYDSMGKVQAVLPPAVSNSIQNNNYVSTDIINKYAYLYLYDNHERLIAKKLPGVDWIRYAYDGADRILLSQDGEQRQRQESTFYIYDIFGRLCITGIADGNISTSSSIATIPYCTFTGSSGLWKGYSVTGLQLSNVKIGIINYYDNYSFTTLLPSNSLPNSSPSYGNSAASTTGNVTGMAIARMDSTYTTTFDYSIIRYDNRGRVIHTEATNYLNGYDIEDVCLNHLDMPTEKLLVHHVPNKTDISQHYTYSYDLAMRLLSATHQIDNGPVAQIADNTYNDHGLLTTLRQEGVSGLMTANLTTTYNYNVRKWLTRISGGNFSERIYYNESHNSNIPQYSGKISAMDWEVPIPHLIGDPDDPIYGYTFRYDALSRLIQADYTEDGVANYKYDTYYNYDVMGNIQSLQRSGKLDDGSYDLIDDVSYTYNGNQLISAEDDADDPTYAGGFNFIDGENAQIEYGYDQNGNMTKDLNKKILRIKHNLLNLPTMIDYSNSAYRKSIYDATGRKLLIEHFTPYEFIGPIETWEEIPANVNLGPALSPNVIPGENFEPITFGTTTQTVYCSNLIYENGNLSKILFDGGYVSMTGSSPSYYFYQKDHLGNVRTVSLNQFYKSQINHYYPFGALTDKSTNGDTQPYKYNCKELDRMSGLDWYDYGARYYDGIRFTTMDPMAEKYYSISPYAYCANNPVNAIDPDGKRMSPIYGLDGDFLGTDDKGLQGVPIVMDKKDYKPIMSHAEALSKDKDINSFNSDDAFEKFMQHYNQLPNRPDYDGYLTLEEANNWYRDGNGQPLYTDIKKLDLSLIRSLGDKYVGQVKTFNLLISSNSLNDGLVYGNITLKRYPNNSVRAYADIYDFDMKSWKNPSSWIRNGETIIGEHVAGKGKPFTINIYGSQELKPMYP